MHRLPFAWRAPTIEKVSREYVLAFQSRPTLLSKLRGGARCFENRARGIIAARRAFPKMIPRTFALELSSGKFSLCEFPPPDNGPARCARGINERSAGARYVREVRKDGFRKCGFVNVRRQFCLLAPRPSAYCLLRRSRARARARANSRPFAFRECIGVSCVCRESAVEGGDTFRSHVGDSALSRIIARIPARTKVLASRLVRPPPPSLSRPSPVRSSSRTRIMLMRVRKNSAPTVSGRAYPDACDVSVASRRPTRVR